MEKTNGECSSKILRPVAVVRLIIPDQARRALILRRARTRYASGAWCLPGGKVDYASTMEQSVADELREETSLSCASCRFLFYQDSLPLTQGGMHCINFYFECNVLGTITLSAESSEFAWVGPSDLNQYEIAFRNDSALLRYWREGA